MTDGQFVVFKKLKKVLLEKRGLQNPDGRNLYQYRITNDEFNELKALLCKWSGMLGGIELSDIIRLIGFPELFVLYASEWWRRRYDGSGFSWEPILHDLDVDPTGWTPTQRSETVRKGLREWRLEVRRTGGLRFLGSVAVQGGLPMRLLAEARGGVGRLLHRALELAQGQQVSTEAIHGWVESLKSLLPKSYRQDAIYALLTDLVQTVLALKQKAGLSAGDDAVAVLDRKIPTWKDCFPLAMEDEHACALVEQLVQEAARVRVRRIPPSLPVIRRLERDLKGRWVLVSRIELPNLLDNEALARLFSLDEEELPRTAQLNLQVEDQRFQTSLRRLAGRSRYRLEPGDWQTQSKTATMEHLLQLSVADGRSWFGEVPGGETLDDELPWLFSAEEGNHALLRQGTGKVADSLVLLALPPSWRLEQSDQGNGEAAGRLKEPDRATYWVTGTIAVTDPNGHVHQIHTRQADSRTTHLHWVGKRLWLEFHNPSRAYRSMPQLYRSDEEGDSSRVGGRPTCSVTGAPHPHAHQCMGPVTLRYPACGEPQIRTRMVLLPEKAELQVNPNDAHHGKLVFINWGIQSVRVADSCIDSSVETQGDRLTLAAKALPNAPTPQWLDLEIGWPHSTHLVGLKVPFPASGVRAFDGEGRELTNGARLTLSELPGVRILVNTGGQFHQLELEIESNQQRRFARRHSLHASPGALSLEVAVIDYLEDIQHLLSLDDSPDARAVLRFRSRGNELFQLEVARYTVLMERDHDQIIFEGGTGAHLSQETLSRLPVLVTRLEYPQDEPLALKPVASEGVMAAAWRFLPSQREAGTWLIYPGPDAAIQFRACIWPVEGEIDTEDELIRAMSLKNQAERDSTIIAVIEDLASNFLHPSWDTVEQLAGQFGHLPLATLDLWRQFSHALFGMAALAFRLSNLPKGFFLRFARELPFAWEVVPGAAWRQAMARLELQCDSIYGAIGETVFASHLDERRNLLTAESGALNYLLGITGAKFSTEDTKQAHRLQCAGVFLAGELFDGENSYLMALRRNHADDTWPTEFHQLVDRARSDPDIQSFLCPEHFDCLDGVINLPLIAAATCAQEKSADYFQDPQAIHLLRTYRSFDIDWFEEAFNRTIARYHAEGVFDG